MQLFILQNGTIELNNAEVLLFDELRAVYDRDKSSKKTQAFKEFNYIYQYCDPKSSPNKEGQSDKKLHNSAKEIARLDDNWEVDDVIKDAMKLYVKVTPGITNKLLREILTSMNRTVTVLNRLGDNIDKTLENEDLTDVQLASLTAALNQILNTAGAFPAHMIKLKEVEKMVIDEDKQEAAIGRGKTVIKSSMNPDTAI